MTVRINEMSRADKEGRTYRGKALPLDDDAAHSAGHFLTYVAASFVECSCHVCFMEIL